MMAYYVLGQGTAPPVLNRKVSSFLTEVAEEASGFLPLHSQGPQKDKLSKEQANVPFVPEENAWTQRMKPALRAAPPPRPPDTG